MGRFGPWKLVLPEDSVLTLRGDLYVRAASEEDALAQFLPLLNKLPDFSGLSELPAGTKAVLDE